MDFLRESVIPKDGKNCPFCPGNEAKTPNEVLVYGRNGGSANSAGWSIRVVPNKFPALGIEGNLDKEGEGLFDKMNGIGAHEVIIESPDHSSTLATLSERALEDVLWAYRDRMLDLKNDKRFRYVLIFKNHGEAAGATVEHTHSQLIALPIVPRRVREEVDSCWHYYDEKERCIFCDIIRQEMETGERVIGENENFITLAPYAPRFPFEMWLLPKAHGSSYENNQSSMYASLARMRCCSDRDQADSSFVCARQQPLAVWRPIPDSEIGAQRLFFVTLAGPQHELSLVCPAISTLIGELLAVGRPPREPA